MLFGAIFVFLWLRERSAQWLLWWGVPMAFNGVALTLYLRSGWQSDFLSIAFGNATRLFAVGCLWYALRLFHGRKLPWGAITSISLIWVGLCLYPPFMASMAARIAVVSGLSALLCALCAFELWRDRREKLHSRMPLLAVFVSYIVLMLVRIPFVGTAPFPVGAGPIDGTWFAAFSWLVVGHMLFASILFLSMTLERREAQQRSFAMSDPLTGLHNRRAFSDFAQRLARRDGLRDPIALLVLDLDHFKQVNDRFGHDAGDRYLKAFAEVSERNVRPADQIFRMGGEEFCCVLPGASLDDAVAVAERIRSNVRALEVATGASAATATVSIGIAATSVAVDIEVLLGAADAALYEAKARGRDRVVVADPRALIRPAAEAVAPMRRRA